MTKKDAYKQKIEAELEVVKAKLAEYKAEAKSAAAEVSIEYTKHVDKLEKMADTINAKLKELEISSEDKWESLKESLESAWNTLTTAVHETAVKFKSSDAKK